MNEMKTRPTGTTKKMPAQETSKIESSLQETVARNATEAMIVEVAVATVEQMVAAIEVAEATEVEAAIEATAVAAAIEEIGVLVAIEAIAVAEAIVEIVADTEVALTAIADVAETEVEEVIEDVEDTTTQISLDIKTGGPITILTTAIQGVEVATFQGEETEAAGVVAEEVENHLQQEITRWEDILPTKKQNSTRLQLSSSQLRTEVAVAEEEAAEVAAQRKFLDTMLP